MNMVKKDREDISPSRPIVDVYKTQLNLSVKVKSWDVLTLSDGLPITEQMILDLNTKILEEGFVVMGRTTNPTPMMLARIFVDRCILGQNSLMSFLEMYPEVITLDLVVNEQLTISLKK